MKVLYYRVAAQSLLWFSYACHNTTNGLDLIWDHICVLKKKIYLSEYFISSNAEWMPVQINKQKLLLWIELDNIRGLLKMKD